MNITIKWTFVSGTLNDSQTKDWLDLQVRSKGATASGSLAFANNAYLIQPDQIPIYALGYVNQQLQIGLPLVCKTHTLLGIKFGLLQTINHDHLDFYVAPGQEYFDSNDLLTSLRNACRSQIKNWHLFLGRRWFFDKRPATPLISPVYSRQAAYYRLESKIDCGQVISKKQLKNLNRFERKLSDKSHSIKLLSVDKNDDVIMALDKFLELESTGWKGKAGSALANNKDTKKFYYQCWTAFAKAGDARMFLLYNQQDIIAAAIAYEHHSSLYLHKITYDESLSKSSPGSIMVKHIIDYAIEKDGLEMICFNTNPPWISRWHPAIHQLVAVQFFNTNIKGLLLRLVFSVTNHLKLLKRKLQATKK